MKKPKPGKPKPRKTNLRSMAQPDPANSFGVWTENPATLLAMLVVISAIAVGVVWYYKIAHLIVIAVVTFIILVTLSASKAFKSFRDTYSDLFKLIFAVGMVAMGGALGTFYLTPTGEQEQVKRLLSSARADVDTTRINAQGLILATVSGGLGGVTSTRAFS